MAAAGSLDDLLNSKVDESAFTALVGTLEDQLYSGQVSSVQTAASGVSNISSSAPSAVSVVGVSRVDARVPANGIQHGVVIAQDGNKNAHSNVPRSAVVTGAGLRNVSAHSQAGVIQTGHFPSSNQASGSVGSAVNTPNVMKLVHTSGSQPAVGGQYTISSASFPNGSNSSVQSVIANGKQTAVGNKLENVVQPSNPATVITVNRPGGIAGAALTGVGATNALASGVQIINVNQARTQSPSMQKALAPRIVLSSQGLNRTASPGQPITLQALQGLQNSGSNHILVRTENGQLKLIQLPVQGGAVATATTISTTALTTTPTYKPQSAMAPDTAKLKCRNFLATLLKLAKEQPDTVAGNVRTLIQNLIDARVEPEAFTSRLQQELNSSPQPCLVPFLKKSLPFLRQSLYNREITIEGVKPPPPSALPTPLGTVPSMHVQPRQVTVSPAVSAAGPTRQLAGAVAAPRNVTSGHPAMLNIQPFQSGAKLVRTPTAVAAAAPASAPSPSPSPAGLVTQRQPPVVTLKKDKRLNFKSSLESGHDDDINDVAAMGGVNLQEESQHILGSTEYVGTQIRSIKDETFLPSAPLQLKMRQIAMRHGLEEPGPDVVALVSHATQERLRSLLEQLAVIAEHRIEVVKSESRYEVSRDVRGQLRFLEELDKLEQKRHEDTEREMLMRAAKSRSKTEDPEQAKLKAKAKEMQRMEMEEVRQREANLTALNAIGPRKKPRLDGEPAAAAADGPTVSGALTQRQIPLRPRLKRVNLRDLLLLLEQERGHQRSTRLYKLFVK
ncbi:transcription initiation factor TFIID subunit 4-like isoform X2 [Pollicipes pollicipes]|uniref:transcription initiation factor TFIID subunit 4-like isoform X2 n=1 Tax=Pollicipes pollicipes TaxID=41117 RepID=UPI001884E936|nr:transcription initiation factor TFIID subunit 4-like isoform X2 [Pollicipes pollicipes]